MKNHLAILTVILLVAVAGGLGASRDAFPARAAFPGMNGKIAFQSDRDCGCPGDVYDVFVMNPDGSSPTNLTNSPTVDDESPAWSPDAGRIAFTSVRNGNADIYMVDRNGEHRLTTDLGGDSTASWSPDGLRIAFMSDRSGRYQVWVMNADGTNQINLSNSTACDQFPAWSPDGLKIAFQSDRDGPPHSCVGGVGSLEASNEIYVMDANGNGQTRLTFNSAFDGHRAAWSPDGTKIAFSSTRDGNGEIYVMNSDGSGAIDLTNTPVNEGYPAWSPDGTRIVYESQSVTGSREVFVMNADGSGQIDLSNHPAKDYLPDWQRLGGDTDNDGLPDGYENAHACLNPTVPDAGADPDGDLLTNMDEYTRGTDPCDPDSDRDSSKSEYVNVHGDGCADGRELLLLPQTNPLDPWDFYSVPVPALFAAPDPPGPVGIIRDNIVGPGDAQAVFAYFKLGAKAGKPIYEQDLNGNGVKDGIEYDRRVVGPAHSGAPDGTVAATDAQLAFAQFKLNYKC